MGPALDELEGVERPDSEFEPSPAASAAAGPDDIWDAPGIKVRSETGE